jgi:hypothetical protein
MYRYDLRHLLMVAHYRPQQHIALRHSGKSANLYDPSGIQDQRFHVRMAASALIA